MLVNHKYWCRGSRSCRESCQVSENCTFFCQCWKIFFEFGSQADIVAALTLEVLKGTTRAFHPRIHEARPHAGQILTARYWLEYLPCINSDPICLFCCCVLCFSRMRRLLPTKSNPSEIASNNQYTKVQDSYTMRCVPQVICDHFPLFFVCLFEFVWICFWLKSSISHENCEIR